MRLVDVRAKKLLSVRELAKASGVAERTVSSIEHGEFLPRLSTIRKLSTALSIEPEAVEEFRAAIEKTRLGKQAVPTRNQAGTVE